MTLFERLAGLFRQGTIPEDARRIYQSSKTTEELVAGREQVLGRNRIEYDTRSEERLAISRVVTAERATLAGGRLDPAEEDRLMDSLDLRLAHLAPVKKSVAFLKTNMLVLYRLIGRIREQQARELRGISEDDIDGILEGVADELASYTRDMAAAAEADDLEPVPDEAAEEAARAERRRRLLASEGAPAAPAPAAPPRRTTVPTRSEETE